MPYVSLKDLKLYYEELGRGETVLFLHSHFSRGILAFGAQIQPFQGKYRCIIPDFRGTAGASVRICPGTAAVLQMI